MEDVIRYNIGCAHKTTALAMVVFLSVAVILKNIVLLQLPTTTLFFFFFFPLHVCIIN